MKWKEHKKQITINNLHFWSERNTKSKLTLTTSIFEMKGTQWFSQIQIERLVHYHSKPKTTWKSWTQELRQRHIQNPVKHLRWSVLWNSILDVWQGSEWISVRYVQRLELHRSFLWLFTLFLWLNFFKQLRLVHRRFTVYFTSHFLILLIF